MIAILLAHTVVLLSVAYMLWKRESAPFRKFFWPALLIKLTAGIALGLLYTYYYTVADTFVYLEDGSRIAGLARTDWQEYIRFLWSGDGSFAFSEQLQFQQSRALFLSKITSVACLFSAGNYWVISFYFSFVSFCGSWFLFRIIARLFPSLKDAAALAILFFPSVVFWSSGVIKESLAMAALYYTVGLFLKIWAREKINVVQWLLLPVLLWVFWNLKYYYMAVLMPVLLTALVVRFFILPRTAFKSAVLEFLIWIVVFLMPLFIVSKVHPNFYPEQFLEVIALNYDAFAELSKPGDAILYEGLRAEVSSVLWHAPKALFSGLFRPFIWEAQNIFQLAAALENAVLLVLLVTSVPHWRNAVRSPQRILVFSGIVYITLLCVFLALSTPNFGTLVRYKVGFLPFFVLLTAAGNPFLLRAKSFLQRRFSSLVQK